MNKCVLCSSTTNKSNSYNSFIVCDSCYSQQKSLVKTFADKRTSFNPETAEIIPNKLYLGNYDFASDLARLKELKITHILAVGEELECQFPGEFVYKKIDLKDITEDSVLKYVDECNEFISASDVVLVHCNACVSRSPAVVMGFLIGKMHMKFKEAYYYIKEKRGVVCPNEKFMSELKQLIDNL